MGEMKKYKITEQFSFNDLTVSIAIKNNIELLPEMATLIGEQGCSLILTKEGFLVEGVFGEKEYQLTDADKEIYQFEVCTKELPPPIPMEDVQAMNGEELAKLFAEDSPYMVTEEDFEERDWTISEVYEMIKKEYPNDEDFEWESVSYGIEELE